MMCGCIKDTATRLNIHVHNGGLENQGTSMAHEASMTTVVLVKTYKSAVSWGISRTHKNGHLEKERVTT